MAAEDIESGSPGERLSPQREADGPQCRFLLTLSAAVASRSSVT
jgi:hypothetical protein